MEVILHIEEQKFVMDVEEALRVCETLNACTRIGREWSSPRSGNVMMFQPPDVKAAFITPITAVLRLEIESNEREVMQGKAR